MRRWQRNSLARNASWMLAGRGLSVLCQSLYFILLGRLLGVVEYGVYAGAFALVSVVSQYSTLGSPVVLLRYVSRDNTQFSKYWGNILSTALCLGSVFVCVICWVGPHFAPGYSHGMLACVAAADCLWSQITTAAGSAFQAFERMHVTAFLTLFNNVLRALTAGCLLFAFHHVEARQWIVAVLAISFLTLCVAVILVSLHFGLPSLSIPLLRKRICEGAVFAVSTSTTNLYNDVDKTMLVHFGMPFANGIYTMAYRAVDAAMIPIGAIQAAAFPRFFRNAAEGVQGVDLLARRILSRTAPISLAMAAALWFAAPLIPHLLGYGFAGSVSAVRVLCILPLFRSLQYSAGDALTGAGYQKARLFAQTGAAAFNFSINLYLIPHFGWPGAAWSSLLTDALLGSANWGLLRVIKRRTVPCLSTAALPV